MDIDPKVAGIASRIRPLKDRVCIQRLEYKHDFLEVVGITLNKGVIVAVGEGRHLRRLVEYRKAEGALTGSIFLPDGPYTGKIRPMRVSVGQVVEYSPNKHDLEFDLDGETFVLIPEQSIYGIDKSESRSLAILSQRSAGWERGGSFLAR